MNYTPIEMVVAIGMLIVAAVLVMTVRRYLAMRSEARMLEMLQIAGVDPGFAADADSQALMKDIRGRCRKCQNESVCERWLVDAGPGKNDFCPNAPIFDRLAKSA